MCGRFTLRTSAQEVAKTFGLLEVPELRLRYNIAPTQEVLTITLQDGKRHGQLSRWGLIPSWADDPKVGYRLINARAETVADKPSFRSAFKRSRCLVVADGFYEWKKGSDAKTKQPHYIRLKEDRPFAFAGLSERWTRNGETIESCTLITTDPNELMAEIHDRMPAILPKDYNDLWLDPEFESKEKLLSLLRPYPADEMTAHPISTLVNSPKNDVSACIEASA
jgi:putative SOS response-associated peptidase YedK